MQLPFLLAFHSLVSLAHCSTPAEELISIAPKPFFIYETVAASSLTSQAQDQGNSLHMNVPKEENAFLAVDDGAEKKVQPAIAKPFIYESVAASLHSGAHKRGSHVRDNVPQEENAFLLDDGGRHVQSGGKREEPILASPYFIYEKVAASLNSRASGGSSVDLRDNIRQEENVSLLSDDGAKPKEHPIRRKEEPTVPNPSYIHESVVDSIHFEAHQGSLLRDNAPQAENSFLLDDGGSHVQSGSKREEPIISKPYFIYESVAASLHSGAHGGSLLHDNVPQEDNTFLLDSGGKKVGKSSAKVASSTQEGGNFIRESVPQEGYTLLRNYGHTTPVSSMQQADYDGKSRADLLASDSQLDHLADDGGKYAFLVDADGGGKHGSPSTYLKEGSSVLHDNAPQGAQGFLVDDGGRHVEHGSIKSSKLNEETFSKDNVPQGEYSFLLDDGGRKELPPTLKDNERKNHLKLPISSKPRLGGGKLRMVVDDSTDNMIKKAHGTPNEEDLRMIVDDSSNRMIEKGYNWPQAQASSTGGNPNEEDLRMVVDDSSNRMIEEGDNRPQAQESSTGGNHNEGKLRMVVGDSSKNMIQIGYEAGRGGGHGRRQSCTFNPNVCRRQLEHEEYVNHIVLYGRHSQLPRRRPACCSGRCVDLSSNHLNCGTCSLPCLLTETCCDGNCVNLNEDDKNCGQCGTSCPPLSPCQMGLCGYY